MYIVQYKDNPKVTSTALRPTGNPNDCAPKLKSQSVKYNTDSSPHSSFLGPYLAGLIEGDGTIIVPKEERSTKGKLNYPSIQITFPI